MLKASVRLLSALLAITGVTLAAESNIPVQLASGPSRVSLIELYTSEGCSSCPRADRWLSGLKSNGGLWSEFVPIAFHVDYWDYIGWEDEFADPDFGDRQRRYAAEGGARFVYTPGIFKDGAEWHDWRRRNTIPRSGHIAGQLALRIAGGQISARFQPMARSERELTLHIVVAGMDLETRVAAGENRGKTLHHDFVALGHRSAPMAWNGDSYRTDTKLPPTSSTFANRAVVAWVSASGRQAPIQAVGGYLPTTD